MKISIIGSGWLAMPLALHLQTNGHQLLLTTTSQKKIAAIQARGLAAVTYQLGEQLPTQLLDAEVLVIAITSKDLLAYQSLFSQLTARQDLQVVFISSTSVYADHSEPQQETSTRLNHTSPIYQIEQLIQNLIPATTILRLAGLVGPKRHPGRFFKNQRPIKNPQAPVNLIHLSDCIGIIDAIIELNVVGEIFNGCADTHPSKGEFYPLMAEQLGLTAPIFEHNEAGTNKLICNQKIKSVLGYQLVFPDVLTMSF